MQPRDKETPRSSGTHNKSHQHTGRPAKALIQRFISSFEEPRRSWEGPWTMGGGARRLAREQCVLINSGDSTVVLSTSWRWGRWELGGGELEGLFWGMAPLPFTPLQLARVLQTSIVLLSCYQPVLEGAALSYGISRFPYCKYSLQRPISSTLGITDHRTGKRGVDRAPLYRAPAMP